MKRTAALTLGTLFISLFGYSQLDKKTWLVGGNASYSLTKNESDFGQRTTSYTILASPDVGYFIADRVATGIKVSVNILGTKSTGTSTFGHYTDVNFGPFIRYYFLHTDKPFNLLAEGLYQYGYLTGGQNGTTFSKNTFALSAGPVIYFNTTIGLEFLVGYSTFKYVSYAGSDGTVQVSLGIQVYLEKDK